MAQADIFAILGNKIVKNLKIFVEVDYLRSQGVLCLHKYFQIINYFISQDSKNVGLSCCNTSMDTRNR